MSIKLASGPTGAAWFLDQAPATISAWEIRLRWTRSLAGGLVVAAALLISPDDFPLRRLAPLVAAAFLIQADIAFRLARSQSVPRAMHAGGIAVDVLILTGLLELSGGPSNPFSVIYAVEIALAAAILGVGWAAAIGAWAAVCYGTLISWHLQELVPAHHRLIDFPTHLFTMWLAISVTSELVAHFVREASSAIAHREAELERVRQQAVRSERLASLTTLAAGAAHELSTPLSTIAVVARELERALDTAAAPGPLDDARLIRQEVERCHVILDQMSGRAGGSHAANLPASTDIGDVVEDLRQRLPADQAARMQVRLAPDLSPVVVVRAGLAQVLLSLVKNAFDASTVDQPVTVEGSRQGDCVRLIVGDEGSGMTAAALQRAGEPFYTTKEPGRGSGLGLFLARMFAERCGGTLQLESAAGTTAILELPLSSEAQDIA